MVSASFFRRIACFLMLSLCLTATAQAQVPGQSIIRDEEIEENLRLWSDDVVRAAGLSPSQVNFVLIQSPDINAFVAGGANIFIYTGLIAKTENPGELVGVIAHELGHIAGGHLTRVRDAQAAATFETLVATVLGVGASVASGNGNAAAAGTAIGRAAGTNSYMAFSRVQESSADQAGFRFLQTAGVNPTGLVTFLGKLSSQELLPASSQSAFMRTHPLSRDRIEALDAKVQESPLRSKSYPAEWNEPYQRMKAKLAGFITPQQVTYAYNSKDNSVAALYARSIAAYRLNQTAEGLKIIDRLIADEPKNPYFHEIKGQMLYESGRVKESVAPYEKALSLKPSAGLIRIAYAQSLIETGGNDKATLNKAVENLKRAAIDEPKVSRVRRLLATAYGRMGDEVRARVYLAEEALMQGRKADARGMAQSALKQLPAGSPEALRAQDVLSAVDTGRQKD